MGSCQLGDAGHDRCGADQGQQGLRAAVEGRVELCRLRESAGADTGNRAGEGIQAATRDPA
ncbi:hypothetical protein [Rothia dentocariosa]|uniref:hypothetical protein n=1 Tax=Rothia dentocariosa TaxID=2047 RepID=UPI00117B1846|nr:hypothetical protein [Rothia dentocariosa]